MTVLQERFDPAEHLGVRGGHGAGCASADRTTTACDDPLTPDGWSAMSRVYGTEAHRAAHSRRLEEPGAVMPVVAQPVVAQPVVAQPRARHHSRRTTLRNDVRQVVEFSARVGSLVTIAAVLVLGATLGGLAQDDTGTTGVPTVPATFGDR